MSHKLERQLLAEVVYRRMRDLVPADALALAELDLADGLARALGGSELAREEAAAAVRDQFDRGWARLEQEWRRFREDPTAAFYEPDCPLCVTVERSGN
jgi:hypothetical protein